MGISNTYNVSCGRLEQSISINYENEPFTTVWFVDHSRGIVQNAAADHYK